MGCRCSFSTLPPVPDPANGTGTIICKKLPQIPPRIRSRGITSLALSGRSPGSPRAAAFAFAALGAAPKPPQIGGCPPGGVTQVSSGLGAPGGAALTHSPRKEPGERGEAVTAPPERFGDFFLTRRPPAILALNFPHSLPKPRFLSLKDARDHFIHRGNGWRGMSVKE